MRIATKRGPYEGPVLAYLRDWFNPASYRRYFSIPILCFAGYVGLVTLPSAFMSLTDFDLSNLGLYTGGFENYQLAAVFLIFVGLVPSLIEQGALVFREQSVVTAFLVLVALYGTWYGFYDGSNTSLVQAAQLYITLLVFYCMLCFWRRPDQVVTDTLLVSAAATAFCLAVALAYNGLPNNRWIGGLHPNFFARSAWVAMGLYMAARRRFSFPALLACLAASVLVGTRTTIVAALVFCVLCSKAVSLNRRKATYVLAGAIIGMLFLLFASTSLLDFDIFNFIYGALDLDSTDRGLSSGLSGRDIIWSEFFRLFDTFYVTGAGFRSERYKDLLVHSGALAYFCDFGVFMGAAIYLAVLSLSASNYIRSHKYGDKRGIILSAFALSSLIYQFSEPDNFQVGVWGSVVFMLALAYPVSVNAVATLEKTFRRTSRPPQQEPGPPSMALPRGWVRARQAAPKQGGLS